MEQVHRKYLSFEVIEDDKQATIIYNTWYSLFPFFIFPLLLLAYYLKWTIVAGILLIPIAGQTFYSMRTLRHVNKIVKSALMTGQATSSGSSFSFSHPVTVVINKVPQEEKDQGDKAP